MTRDYEILRSLGERVAELAALPIQDEKKKLWTANNDLKPVRPMVYIDQLPWFEFDRTDEMKRECEDPFLHTIEEKLKQIIYRWKHFPADMVVENRVDVDKTVHNLNYGINIIEKTLDTDSENDIKSHQYKDQLKDDESLDKLKNDEIWVDTKLDEEHLEICNEIFKDIMPVRLCGVQLNCAVWDRIAQMMTAEGIIYNIIDRPEFVKRIVKKFVALSISTVEQCEKLGLLDEKLQYIHCTGAYTNDMPTDGMEDGKAKAHNVWALGMAQIFSTVSPEMHNEYEIELVKPLYEKFGMMYYGCCEPLDNVIKYVRKIKNVRKISVSPWANNDICADNIGSDYVFSSKINPSFICANEFAEKNIRNQIEAAYNACKRNKTPLELIQKDVSSLNGHLDYIDRWEKIAMEYALR